MRTLISFFVLLSFSMLFGQIATAPSGSGTVLDPYQITNLENLYWISQNSGEWVKYYEQTADIDASATSGWAGGGWTPIGSGPTPFSGSYNGQGHIISGIKIKRSVVLQGLFGKTSGATIQNLGVTAVNVEAPQSIGGLIGGCNSSTVSNCYSTGQTKGDGSWSESIVGGLIGIIENSSTVSNCYSTANVSTSYSIMGGFVGEINGATVSNCYSKGSVTLSDLRAGGFVGKVTSATVTNCFWDTQTSGKATSAAGTGKTTLEMTTRSTFTDAGWDYSTIWGMNSTANSGYPFLLWQGYASEPLGIGTSEDPYQIANLNNLLWIVESSDRWAAYYKQTTDIDMSSTQYWDDVDDDSDGNKYNDPNDETAVGNNEGWPPIGNATTKFSGSYNGQVHTINGLFIARASLDYVGLFGYTNLANIENIGVTNVNIAGSWQTGGLVGLLYANSTISNCYSIGNVSGAGYVGCLVGHNDGGSTVSKSYSSGTVIGSSNYIGGLVGGNRSSTASNSYSTANVSTSGIYVGGLVGYHTSSSVSNSYSTGTVSGSNYVGGLVGYLTNGATESNCFWDTQTSGRLTSAAGDGKTTAEMKTNTTFIAAGWDPAIWNIGDGINDGYPYLDWQNTGGTPLPVELTSFTAATSSASTGSATAVVLNWTTATEVNNYGFEIQRSVVSDQRSEWETIGFVEGNGNSNSPKEYSYIDENIAAGNYLYRLKQIDNNGGFSYGSEVEVNIETIPIEFALHQNYPNPFNPSTTIKYSIPSVETHSGASVQNILLKVYDILGNEFATLVNENKSAGNYEVKFDASNLSSGVYFYQLNADSFTATKKLILLK